MIVVTLLLIASETFAAATLRSAVSCAVTALLYAVVAVEEAVEAVEEAEAAVEEAEAAVVLTSPIVPPSERAEPTDIVPENVDVPVIVAPEA